jgi:hypothetical protein
MKLNLPPGPFRAYLFDCDGTIADSMPLHYIAWKKALGEWGCTFDEELFYAWGGKPAIEIITDLNRMQGLNMPAEALAEHKENLYFALLPELKPIPEVLELIQAEHGRIPFAVVSGGRRNSVTNSLPRLASWINSKPSSARKTTRTASPLPTPISSPPPASASPQRTASSSKTPTWASSLRPLPEWPPSRSLLPLKEASKKATEPKPRSLRKMLQMG